jgi:hypothetical protein
MPVCFLKMLPYPEIGKRKITYTLDLLKELQGLGFTISDLLITLTLLGLLDNANCLILTEKEISELLGLSSRTIIRTMVKLKNFGVTKNGYRYDFTGFISYVASNRS